MSVASEPSTSSSVQLSEQCRHFTLFDILLATNNFDESLVIGRGGFGKVYRGTIFNGSANVLAAIKRLDSSSNQGAPEFWAEVEMLSKLRHCNLVSLFGYCNDEEEMVLVYEYMPNGTLEDHLHKLGTPLSWLQRLKICIGAGRGLHYLHTGTGIDVGVIHRDVKTSNILLQESWAAKISDFGLSKIGRTNQPSTCVNTRVKGTFGYFDPDYYATGKLTRKSDVYAFGVVLLEVLCRKRAVFDVDEEAFNLAIWAQESIKEGNLKNIIDPYLRGQISSKCLKEFVRITERCLHSSPKKRSTMAEVLFSLESSMLNLPEKFNKSVQRAGRTILDRMINLLPFPSNRENTEFLGIDARPNTFSYAELRTATDYFSAANKLGEGSFGSVYKGTLDDGRVIAVKQLIAHHHGKAQFMTEIKVISAAVQHRNIVKLYGCCIQGEKRLLVYEYVENKSLDQALFGKIKLSLSWSTRFEICLGVAHGLTNLHEESRIRVVHRDVKASNVLLDSELNPKIADFGLAKLFDDKQTHMSTRIAGTIGYLAPEYAMRGHLTEKADVFGFGVVALEIISGRRNSDSSLDDDKVYLLEWAWNLHEANNELELVDEELSEFNENEVRRMMRVALLCTQTSPMQRPSMSRVIAMLSGDIEPTGVITRPEYLTDFDFTDITSFQSAHTTSGTDSSAPSTSTSHTVATPTDAASRLILHDIIGEEFLGIDTRPNTFSYAELRTATDDFSAANKLGEGGFGPVYKGTLDDGRVIAVKQLSIASRQGKSQFMAEIATISAVQHRNLVKLFGCCIDGEKRLLVYEHLENKSLDQALFGKSKLSLSWSTRFEICLGVAHGLTYLHEESSIRVVHRDVKASNVLLDSELNPKISDFGLAKLYDDKQTHMSTRVAGTIGYLAPEYAMCGHLTEKADVFGFGVVALEIISGRPNSDSSLDDDKIYLLEWAWNLHEAYNELELVDEELSEFNENQVRRVMRVALLCTQTSPMRRPSMSRVIAMLSGDIEPTGVITRPEYLTRF